jgi:hypothetical protein
MCSVTIGSLLLFFVIIELAYLFGTFEGGVYTQALNLAEDYHSTFFPCDTSCSNRASCHATGWGEAAKKSRALTQNCSLVVYSVALGGDVDVLNDVTAYPTVCNVMFLDGRSILARSQRMAKTIGNWTVVIAYNLEHSFSNMRRAGKIPKLSPDTFFNERVEFAIYLDAKLQLLVNPLQTLQLHMLAFERVLMAAVCHPKSAHITAEVNAIKFHQQHRPDITDSVVTVVNQASYYNSTGLLNPFRQTMVEGAILLHRLHHPAAITLRCAWMDQVLRYSDRDQVLNCIQSTLALAQLRVAHRWRFPSLWRGFHKARCGRTCPKITSCCHCGSAGKCSTSVCWRPGSSSGRQSTRRPRHWPSRDVQPGRNTSAASM